MPLTPSRALTGTGEADEATAPGRLAGCCGAACPQQRPGQDPVPDGVELAGLPVRELILRLARTEDGTRSILVNGAGTAEARRLLNYQSALLAELRRRREQAPGSPCRGPCQSHRPVE